MKIVVTGASGRLGRTLCRMLAESGETFTGVDHRVDDSIGFPIVSADLRNPSQCEGLFDGVDVLVHLANNPNWNVGNPLDIYNDNLVMNRNVFGAAIAAGCKRIIFASSIQVCNGFLPIDDRDQQEIVAPYIPFDSDMPAIPRNMYALSKEAGESLLRFYSETQGIVSVSIRYPLLLDEGELRKVFENGGMHRGKCFDAYAYLPMRSGAAATQAAMTASLRGYNQYFVASNDNLEQRSARDVYEEQLSLLPLRNSLESLVDCMKAEGELEWRQPRSLSEEMMRDGKN